MSLIAEITIHDPILFVPTFERVPDAECRFENFHYVTDAEGNIHYVFFWWTRDCDFAEFERALENDSTVSDFRVITELEDRRLYRIVSIQFPPDQPLVFPFFREHDTTSLAAKRTANGLDLRARFPSQDAFKSFLDASKEIGENTTVNAVYAEDPGELPQVALTQKQREALTLALERGYFESPSQVTLEELAAEIDITPQTLSRHIRLGVKTLVERSVGNGIDRGDL